MDIISNLPTLILYWFSTDPEMEISIIIERITYTKLLAARSMFILEVAVNPYFDLFWRNLEYLASNTSR
jgi:hypothetical protein